MPNRGFWEKLKKPIIGLAPMDGVTDAAFRYMVCKYSKPSVVITEFTNVEGLARGNVKGLAAFIYSEIERPVVAQIFGVEPESYYKAAVMLSAMGFDGIDINMGCPVNKVAAKGSGAALIKTPELAKKLVLMTKKGVKDWSEGISLEKAGVHPEMIAAVKKMNSKKFKRKIIPVSIKTRIGYDSIVAEEWVKHLLEVEPANISMHGRTLKQLYMGVANWEELAKACRVVKSSGLKTSFLGNGDVKSMADAHEKIKDYGVDGVLAGRAAFGNPWFFEGREPTVREGLKAAIEHAKYFEKLNHLHFQNVRKHLGRYVKGFEGAKELRIKLMQLERAQDVEREILPFLKL
ncbi:tRNA-dihydrouridine synthase [Candidatus Peregrinibacteria bacterium]|nr:tRNA-dihydrouridine synthase [Candidatus Peregrinibacteria bacterium]